MRRPHRILLALAATAALTLSACGGGDDAPADTEDAGPGAEVYSANCARCHGPDGEGGVGPQLGGGAVAENYPDIDDQIAVIRDGRNGMPAWDGQLSPEEIQAVAEYTRDQLGQ